MTYTKHTLTLVSLAALLLGGGGPAIAQVDPGQISGSDERHGAIAVSDVACASPVLACADLGGGHFELALPLDGVIHVSSLHVGTGATLTFLRNPDNTPVQILSTGRVTVDGTIDVSGTAGTATEVGRGGPGGFDGGTRTVGGVTGSGGMGPGGGGFQQNAAHAGYGYPNSGTLYGNTLVVPPVGGSGGGGEADVNGGGGGGAILLASDLWNTDPAQPASVQIGGSILARGAIAGAPGSHYYGNGSGGAIRVVAPRVSGSGVLDASGGVNIPGAYVGGPGRIRIDAIELAAALSLTQVGVKSTGQFLQARLPVEPELDIVRVGDPAVGGRLIDVDGPGPVYAVLDLGASPLQEVVVQPDGFSGPFCMTVAGIPATGAPFICNDCPVAVSGNVATTVTLNFPVNVVTRISAWTVPSCP